MKPDPKERDLRQAIAAVEAGERAEGRRLLLAIVERDEENHLAWLWLSRVVESVEERRICLENVLVLDPDNGLARAALAKLRPPGESPTTTQVVRRQREAPSLAAAVLYPERQIQEWVWEDNVALRTVPDLTFQAQSAYDDVWETEADICAFCAGEISPDDRRCPQCGRRLIATHYRYQKASTDLAIYFVLLLGVGEISFVLLLFGLLNDYPMVTLIRHAFVTVFMTGLALVIVLRRFWAYTASIVALLLILAAMLLEAAMGVRLESVAAQLTGLELFRAIGDSPAVVLMSPIVEFFIPVQLVAVVLALLYGLLRVGPDFERVSQRYVAGVDKGLHDAGDFFSVGKQYESSGMWANAILHYQRAVAHEPGRTYYQRKLGEAYGHLGFTQRGLDVLQTAQAHAATPESQAELDAAIESVRQGRTGARS